MRRMSEVGHSVNVCIGECVICIIVTFIYINTYLVCRLYMKNRLNNADSLTFM